MSSLVVITVYLTSIGQYLTFLIPLTMLCDDILCMYVCVYVCMYVRMFIDGTDI